MSIFGWMAEWLCSGLQSRVRRFDSGFKSQNLQLEGSDIKEIQEGLGSDRRIGKEFLNAGIGYGGSCFPKDLSALQFLQRQHNFSSSIIFETIKRNNRQLKNFEHSIRNFF